MRRLFLTDVNIRIVSGDKSGRVPGNKTKRDKDVPLNADAQSILLKRRKKNENHDFVFLRQRENPLDNDNIYRNLKRLLTKHRQRHPLFLSKERGAGSMGVAPGF